MTKQNFQEKPRKVYLTESDIRELIELLQREPHGIFTMLHYQKLIDKLNGVKA
jgi:hypothetical protein